MTQIQSSASYVRNKATLRNEPGAAQQVDVLAGAGTYGSDALLKRVWQLLETPQTVVSLCRAVDSSESPDGRVDAPTIEALLKELLQRDLIQLSPDS
jgi:hypothetical protein